MGKQNYYLITGGVISGLISILHVILAFNPGFYQYIVIAQLPEQSFTLISIATALLALVFAIWAIYAFSGAGLIGRLPMLRKALIAIGVIYILRSLFLFTEINLVLTQGYPFRFTIFSTISLVTGLLYLIGILKQRASFTPSG
jgi:hypothetical protein